MQYISFVVFPEHIPWIKILLIEYNTIEFIINHFSGCILFVQLCYKDNAEYKHPVLLSGIVTKGNVVE